MSFKKTLSSAAVAAALAGLSVAANAAVFPDFTVDRDLNPATSNSFVADKITGNYVEVITFAPSSQTTGSFSYKLRWVAGQFVTDDGTTPLDSFDTGLGSTYRLYALVSGSGTYSRSGFATTFITNPGGSLDFIYDPLLGATSFSFSGAAITAANIFTRANAGDDKPLLASGSAISGSGTLDPSLSTCVSGINCGSFGQESSIALNADGAKFFTAPSPFYTLAFNSGQLNNFNVSGTQVINGSLDVVFAKVPEPTSVALVGLALLGAGVATRRSASKKK